MQQVLPRLQSFPWHCTVKVASEGASSSGEALPPPGEYHSGSHDPLTPPPAKQLTYNPELLGCCRHSQTAATAFHGGQAAAGSTSGEWDIRHLLPGKSADPPRVSSSLCWQFSQHRLEGLHVGLCGLIRRSTSGGEGRRWSHPSLPVSPETMQHQGLANSLPVGPALLPLGDYIGHRDSVGSKA